MLHQDFLPGKGNIHRLSKPIYETSMLLVYARVYIVAHKQHVSFIIPLKN